MLLKHFDINAVDYIHKTGYKERLQKAVTKALERFNAPAKKIHSFVNTDKGKSLLYFSKFNTLKPPWQTAEQKEVFLVMAVR
jgi:DNA-binding LytR/AlgR family response regulator